MIVERWHAVLDAQPVAIAETATALVLGLDDGRVLHLDWRNGRALARVALHEAGLLALAVSPDGRHVLSGGADGHLVVSTTAGALLSVACRDWVDRVAWVDRARAVGTAGTHLARLDVDGQSEQRDLRRGVMALATSSSRAPGIIAVAVSGSLLLVDAADLGRVEEHRVRATGRSLAAHPAGAGWALGTQEQTLLCLRMSDRRLSRLEGYVRPPRDVAFSPDGTSLATSGMDLLVVWSLPRLDCDEAEATLVETDAEPVSLVRFQPLGRGLAVVTKAGTLFALDAVAGTRVRVALGAPPTGLVFSSDGRSLACTTTRSAHVYAWSS